MRMSKKPRNGLFLVCFYDSDEREITVLTEAKNETNETLIARVSKWLKKQYALDMDDYEGQVVRVRKPYHIVVMDIDF